MKMKKSHEYKNLSKPLTKEAITILSVYYSDAICSLNFISSFELVVALILAAQCTDERVNKITPILFKKYPDVYAVAKASYEDIEKIVKPCGFYKNKAKSIVDTANIIVNKFNGNVPDNMKDLCTLKGIGRKSSNIILQECFNRTEGIAVDTHVTRISRKIGFSNGKSQIEIEKELMNKFDKKYWSVINHVLVYHGRKICIANRPNCDICPINTICKKNK